jgi:hypothetical protein
MKQKAPQRGCAKKRMPLTSVVAGGQKVPEGDVGVELEQAASAPGFRKEMNRNNYFEVGARQYARPNQRRFRQHQGRTVAGHRISPMSSH